MNIKIALLPLALAAGIGCSDKEQTPGDVTPATSTAATSQMAAVSSVATSAWATSSAQAPSVQLTDTYWKLVGLNGKDIAIVENSREAHIMFGDDQRVTGSDGCNRFMGGYQLSGESLSFEQLAGTKMACADGDAQAQEFTTALTQATTHQIQGEFLDLFDNAGNIVARFAAVDQPDE
jgi:heat shock protein HslJ